MTFNDEQKQAEFEAFAAYYRLVAKRPHTSAKMSRMNQLESIIRGDYPGALQELKGEQRRASVEKMQERQLGKQAGGGQQTRRGSSPVVKQPQPGTARYERLKAAGLLPSQQAAQEQGGKSEAVKVVAGDDKALSEADNPAKAFYGAGGAVIAGDNAKEDKEREVRRKEREAASEKARKDGSKAHGEIKVMPSRENTNIVHLERWDMSKPKDPKKTYPQQIIIDTDAQLSTGAAFDTETGRTENDMIQDAVNLNAKDLVEKYGRDLIFEKLLQLGETGDTLIEKTDRQLANILKKKAMQQFNNLNK